MKACTLRGFMDELGPWIDKDYIRSAAVTGDGNIALLFTDGVEETFSIEGCSQGQVRDIMAALRKRGVPVR